MVRLRSRQRCRLGKFTHVLQWYVIFDWSSLCLGHRAETRFCFHELYQHQCSYLDTKYTQSRVSTFSSNKHISHYYGGWINFKAEKKQHNIVLV
jgi:hypothetical protein